MTSEQDLTTVEIAEQLRVSTAAVTAWCRSGQLVAYRAGSRWRVKQIDLAKFVRNGIPRTAELPTQTA